LFISENRGDISGSILENEGFSMPFSQRPKLANRHAKKFDLKTGMACFEAKRICPKGVLCRPHYDEYRRLSQEIFRILEEYSPTLVPISFDEGFLDFTPITDAERWGALDEAAHKLNTQFVRTEKPALMTGAQLALRQLDDAHKNPNFKCPFVPQREMVKKLWATDANCPLIFESACRWDLAA
jgi:DNA polymerase-4